MIELEGYKTTPATPYGCDGCAFDVGTKCANELAECIPATRSDGRNVIFVKVDPKVRVKTLKLNLTRVVIINDR